MGERRRKKKQFQSKMQEGGLLKREQPQQPGLLHLQDQAGNRAVSDLISAFSGVPQPSFVRTPLGVTATVYFAQNSAFLDAANYQVVEQLAQELGYLSEPIVTVDGHASAEGKESYNLSLSERRRQLVIALLTARQKVPPEIKGEAFGETQPAIPEDAQAPQELEQQQAQNRRVEISILYKSRITEEPEEPQIDLGLGRLRFEPPPGPLDFKPPPPIKRPKISIAGEFDKKFNTVVDDVLDGLNIKTPWMRDLLKRGARAAVDKGAEALLDQALDGANIQGEKREAFKKGLEAGLKFEF